MPQIRRSNDTSIRPAADDAEPEAGRLPAKFPTLEIIGEPLIESHRSDRLARHGFSRPFEDLPPVRSPQLGR